MILTITYRVDLTNFDSKQETIAHLTKDFYERKAQFVDINSKSRTAYIDSFEFNDNQKTVSAHGGEINTTRKDLF
jgi:hypothetical protein